MLGGWRASGVSASLTCSNTSGWGRRGVVIAYEPRRSSIVAQGFQRFMYVVVHGPEGVQGGHVQQFAGLGGRAGDNDLAALYLHALVAAEEEGKEHRADVVD